MKRTTKTHLDLSKSNGLLTAIVDARKQGQYTRTNTWSANGDTRNTRAARRDAKKQLRNYTW